MTTFNETLSQVFPYRLLLPLDSLPGLVTMLSFPRTGAGNGSSFAVTSSDAPDGYRYLWLTQASMLTISDNTNRNVTGNYGIEKVDAF